MEIKILVREPCILYIADPTELPEIWRSCPGEQPLQITDTGGKIQSFSAANDGNTLLYTASNDDGSVDIWQSDRDGDARKKLLSCELNECREIIFNPVKKVYALAKIGKMNELIIMDSDLQNLFETSAFASDLQFSPDGTFLSFFDHDSEMLVIVDLSSYQPQFYPSGIDLIGAWSPDGERILFGQSEFEGGLPETTVFEINAAKHAAAELFQTGGNEIDIYKPQYAPGNSWLLAGVRDRSAGFSKQLWLVHRSSGEIQKITENYLHNHSAYSWNSDYSQLVFQRVRIDVSTSQPEIWIWNAEDQEYGIIAQNASQPHWLP